LYGLSPAPHVFRGEWYYLGELVLEEVRVAHPYVLYACGVIGMLASAFGAYVTFRSQWTTLFTIGHWRLWLGVLCGVSIAAAVLIYAISEYVHRREAPRPTLTPAG
jgi:hypothetical protein